MSGWWETTDYGVSWNCKNPATLNTSSGQTSACLCCRTLFLQRDQELHQTADVSDQIFWEVTLLTTSETLRGWDQLYPATRYSQNSAIYIYIYIHTLLFVNSFIAASMSVCFVRQSLSFWLNFFFLIYIYKNIWTKFYYLLYNINNKIFAFLLLWHFLLHHSSAFTGWKESQKSRALQSALVQKDDWLCGHINGDSVCVSSKWWNH